MYISPKNILTDFFRKHLTDPRGRGENTNTETFDGGGTDFNLTAPKGKVQAIKDVQVDGTSKNKWEDYTWDMQNEKIIFKSNTPSGTGNISIEYKYGTSSWIFPDKSRKDLSEESFPRINFLKIGGTADRLGQYNSDIEDTVPIQADIWSKENQVFTIDNHNYEGDKLTEYFGYEMKRALRNHIEELFPALYNYTQTSGPRDMGFDKDMQCFHTIWEFETKSVNIEEV